jgi:hypothetical protein
MPGCCDRPVSKNDHLWDNYCQEKWCPKVDCGFLRPWWHGLPNNAGCCDMPACSCPGPACGTSMGPQTSEANYTPAMPVTTQGAPVPATSALPAPTPAPAPPMATPETQAPAPAADEPLQLKLLPLSRQRAIRP